MSLTSEGQSLSGDQMSSTYLNLRLRYNYFRFWKTNVRHIVILLPVLISTISLLSACHSASSSRISSKSEHPPRKYDVISIFKIGAVGLVVFTLGWWRTTHEVPYVVWIPSSNRYFVGLIVPEILRCKDFGVLAWKCLFTPLFGEFLGEYFSIWRHPSSWPTKGASLGGNTSFEPFSVRISATVRPGRVTEKKNSITKSHKSVIFPLFRGEAPAGPIRP